MSCPPYTLGVKLPSDAVTPVKRSSVCVWPPVEGASCTVSTSRIFSSAVSVSCVPDLLSRRLASSLLPPPPPPCACTRSPTRSTPCLCLRMAIVTLGGSACDGRCKTPAAPLLPARPPPPLALRLLALCGGAAIFHNARQRERRGAGHPGGRSAQERVSATRPRRPWPCLTAATNLQHARRRGPNVARSSFCGEPRSRLSPPRDTASSLVTGA
mmetsp:Transcript_473/g.1361  ORF Transcript_473/g.1361 Transcript_473/m.1361 type:complete len:213 (-) Transcript_473:116-754(-)